MSKLYNEYLKRKSIDNNKYYLFKSGLFYIFIDEDAKYISNITLLKLTNLSNDIVKCGFPSNSLDKYIDLFNNIGLGVEIIDKLDTFSKEKNKDINSKVIKKLKNILADGINIASKKNTQTINIKHPK